MLKKISGLLALSLLLAACGGSKHSNGFELKGTLSNAVGGETVYLEELSPMGKLAVDSAVLDEKGNFAFENAKPAAGFFRIKVNEANFAMLILDSTQKVNVTGDFKDLGNSYKVEGSPDTKVFLEMNDLGKIVQLKADSFQRVFQEILAKSKKDSVTIDSINKSIEPKYMAMIAEHQKKVADVVDRNSASLAALVGIQQLTPDTYMDLYKKVYKDLSAKFPGSKYLYNLKKNVDSYSKLIEGSEAPDFTMATIDGKSVKLSSLRGKIVMIDFWASWCGPCRKENPNVVNVYKKFHEKGFEILGVSVDDKADKWKEAVAKDGLPWIHVSDLQGWNNEAVLMYGVDAIPFTVLLDKEGKILAKGLRGAKLEAKLEELFK
ncbi:MAG: redoxin family protein [Bacteroidia bacterium]